jgi:hypothetical protein
MSMNKSFVRQTALLLSFVYAGEVLSWVYRISNNKMVNAISYSLTTASLILLFSILWIDTFKKNNELRGKSDKLIMLGLIYSLLVIIYSIYNNSNSLITVFLNPYTTSPLVLMLGGYILGKKIYSSASNDILIAIIRSLSYVNLLLFILGLYSLSFMAITSEVLSRSCYIGLLYILVKPKKKDYFFIILNSLIFFVATYQADVRANFMFFFAVWAALIFEKLGLVSKVVFKMLFIGAVALGIFIIFNSEAIFDHFFNLSIVKVKGVSQTDTRTFIYNEFFDSFKSFSSLFIGKGLLGTYYSDYFFNVAGTEYGADSYERFSVEVGIFQLILKYGLCFLLIVFGIIMTTILNYNKKITLRVTVVFILSMLMFIEFTPSFSIRYFIFWIVIGFINSEISQRTSSHSLRNKTFILTHG